MQAKDEQPGEVKHLTGNPDHDQSDHGWRPSRFDGPITLPMVRLAFEAGVRAQRHGKKPASCPFGRDTVKDRTLRVAWTRGWNRSNAGAGSARQ